MDLFIANVVLDSALLFAHIAIGWLFVRLCGTGRRIGVVDADGVYYK